MARSEALKRAQEKYDKKFKMYTIRIDKESESDIVCLLNEMAGPAMRQYIIDLIRKDIEKRMNTSRTVTFTDEQALATIHALQAEIKETEAAMAEDTAPNNSEAMEKQFNHCKFLANIVSMISSEEAANA